MCVWVCDDVCVPVYVSVEAPGLLVQVGINLTPDLLGPTFDPWRARCLEVWLTHEGPGARLG